MEHDLLGRACALLSALAWAVGTVLFKRCVDTVSPVSLNLFKNVVALVLLGATLLVFGDTVSTLAHFPPADIAILLISGVLGIAIADTLFLRSLSLLGVGLITIVECLYSPLVIAFAFLFLSEELVGWHYVGGAMVLSAVFISSRHAAPPGRTRRQIVAGVALGSASVALMAASIVMVMPILQGHGFPLILATMLRLAGGTIVLGVYVVLSPNRTRYLALFRPTSVWKYSIPGSVVGGFLAMVCWIAGFKYTQAAVAAILNQTSIVFAMILAAVFLRERMTRRKLLAALIATAGVAVITVLPTPVAAPPEVAGPCVSELVSYTKTGPGGIRPHFSRTGYRSCVRLFLSGTCSIFPHVCVYNGGLGCRSVARTGAR